MQILHKTIQYLTNELEAAQDAGFRQPMAVGACRQPAWNRFLTPRCNMNNARIFVTGLAFPGACPPVPPA
jgi:hypothetical protein